MAESFGAAAITRRACLTRAAAAGGASLVYEAMTGPGVLGGDYMSDMSSWMQGAFESARTVATAIHARTRI